MRWHHGADHKAGASLPPHACPALPCLAALPAYSCHGTQHRAGSGVPELGWASQHTTSLLP